MATLPSRTTLDDIVAICSFLIKKPTGPSIEEAKKVVDAKLLDFRKITAYKTWGLITESDAYASLLTAASL
jgi:hypothetical protein